MTAVRKKQFRYRERPSGRRKTKFVIGLLALAPYINKARRSRPGRARATARQPLRIAVTVDPDWPGHAR